MPGLVDNKKIVRRFAEEFINEGNYDTAVELLAEDIADHTPLGEPTGDEFMAPPSDTQSMLPVGEKAPAFELPNQDGDPVSLSEFEGEGVVVYFYPRANTAGCTTEACGFRDSWDAFTERGIRVLGISDDPIEDLEPFHTDYDLPFDLLSDEDGEVATQYDSYGEKNMFGNTFDGVFRNTYVIDADGVISQTYEGVTPEGHADEILADIGNSTR